MLIIVSTKLKIHRTAQDRFVTWASGHAGTFAPLQAALETSQGKPDGAIQAENGRWMWAFGGTFVSYIIRDTPVALYGTTASMPFLRERHVIVTDIFAV